MLGKRRFITCKQNAYQVNAKFDLSVAITRESSPVDNFYTEKVKCDKTGEESICFKDPIFMLFNQERLMKMGDGAVQAWLDSLSQFKQSPVAKLREKMSDSQLIELIKSRHIQQPSELMAWAEFCQAEFDNFKDEEQAELEKNPPSETVEPQPTDTPTTE